MIRRLYTLVCILLLAMSVAVAILWARSHSVIHVFYGQLRSWPRADVSSYRSLDFRLVQGYLTIVYRRLTFNFNPSDQASAEKYREQNPGGMSFRHDFIDIAVHEAASRTTSRPAALQGKLFSLGPSNYILGRPNRYGFDFSRVTQSSKTSTSHFTILVEPAWLPLAVTLILPGCWGIGYYRIRKRIVAGCCVNCGYDLRATPDRCPECGTIPLKKEIVSN